MKHILPIIAALVIGVPAHAADLGGSKDRMLYPEVTASPTWNGWYIGGHVGYGWGEFDGTRSVRHEAGKFKSAHCSNADITTESNCTGSNTWTSRTDDLIGYETDSQSGTSDMNGVFGGIDLSYKVKVGKMIFEPFADVSWGGGKGSRTWEREIDSYTDTDGEENSLDPMFEVGHASVEKNWDGTFGLKTGFLVTPSDYFYGLAGLKYGSFTVKGGSHMEGSVYGTSVEDLTSVSYSSNENQWGYTFGGGLEHAVNDRLHVGIEGRYTAYSDLKVGHAKTVDIANSNYTAHTSDNLEGDYGEWSVRGRISYRLGGE